MSLYLITTCPDCRERAELSTVLVCPGRYSIPLTSLLGLWFQGDGKRTYSQKCSVSPLGRLLGSALWILSPVAAYPLPTPARHGLEMWFWQSGEHGSKTWCWEVVLVWEAAAENRAAEVNLSPAKSNPSQKHLSREGWRGAVWGQEKTCGEVQMIQLFGGFVCYCFSLSQTRGQEN